MIYLIIIRKFRYLTIVNGNLAEKYKDYTPYPGFYNLRIFDLNSKEFFATWHVQEFLYCQSMRKDYYKQFAPLEWEKLKDLSAQLEMILLPKLKPGETLW